MGTRDKRVDAYIAKAAPFAQPILTRCREIVHETCPAVEETIKWRHCSFEYKGMLCGMAAFKEHCTFMFWKNGLVVDAAADKSGEAMGELGRMTSLKDLPAKKTLARYIKRAMELNDAGVKLPRRASVRKSPQDVQVPEYFMSAIAKNKRALATFEAFPYSKRKDYVEWITEAKTEATRARRMQTAVEWIAEGKARHWKYEKC